MSEKTVWTCPADTFLPIEWTVRKVTPCYHYLERETRDPLMHWYSCRIESRFVYQAYWEALEAKLELLLKKRRRHEEAIEIVNQNLSVVEAAIRKEGEKGGGE